MKPDLFGLAPPLFSRIKRNPDQCEKIVTARFRQNWS